MKSSAGTIIHELKVRDWNSSRQLDQMSQCAEPTFNPCGRVIGPLPFLPVQKPHR
jgi:hypothetical protein